MISSLFQYKMVRFSEKGVLLCIEYHLEGYAGFEDELNAENYIAITRASRATTTRDLQGLVKKGALVRTRERRQTRYWLNLPDT